MSDNIDKCLQSWSLLEGPNGERIKNLPIAYNSDQGIAKTVRSTIVPRVICEQPTYTYDKKFTKKQSMRDFFSPVMLQCLQTKEAAKIELDRGETIAMALEVIQDIAEYHHYNYEVTSVKKTLFVIVTQMTV